MGLLNYLAKRQGKVLVPATRQQVRQVNRIRSGVEDKTKLQRMMEDIQESTTGLNAGLVDNDSSPFYDPIAYWTLDAIDEGTYRENLRRFFILYKTHPLVHGWIETLVDFIVGDEFQLKSLDHDPRTQEWFDKHWENMAGPRATQRWPGPVFARQLCRRSLSLGEDFQRVFVNKINGETWFRPLHPVFIYSGFQKLYTTQAAVWTNNITASFGIQVDPYDNQRILNYFYDPYRNGMLETIPGDDVIHTKLGDVEAKRGESVLLCIVEYLIELEKILKACRKQHQIRAEIAYWDEPIGDGFTPEEIKDLMDESTIGDAGINQGNTYAAQSGTGGIINGLKRVYATPDLQAADGDVHIRRILQCIAVGLQEAYYMISADTAGDSMASIRETSYPQVRSQKSKQRLFGITAFENIAERIVKNGIEYGSLSETSFQKTQEITGGVNGGVNIVKSTDKVPRNTKFVGLYPSLEVRDIKAMTDALAGQIGLKLVSKRSSQIQLGYNADEEDAQIAKEEIEDPTRNDEIQEMMAAMKGATDKPNGNGHTEGNGLSNNNGGRGGNGRSDSKAIYRRSGTKS